MKEKKKKKQYEKPELKSIHLLAEEVLGVGCKVSGGSAITNSCDSVTGCGFEIGS